MSKKENKKANQVIRDMKECFRSFYLPVYKNKHVKDIKLAFTSQICNDHVCAGVAVTYDRPEGYVGIDISFRSKVPSDKMAEISRLLNLLNSSSPLYGYSVCQCCNTVSVRAVLYVPEEVLPKEKFRRLIRDMLEETYRCSPLIAEVVKSGDAEGLYDRFMEDHKDLMKMESTISKERAGQILGDMESVITGLKIPINENDRLDNGFAMSCMIEGMNFPLRMGITVDHEDDAVILNMAPPFTIPDDKIPVVTELVSRINRMSGPDHLFIDRQTKRVVLLTAAMVDNGALDKREFEKFFRTMLGNGSLCFPIINEQLSSNENPEVLLAKLMKNYKDSHSESK